jgi:tRNA nucleotidyltransferase (CCA-adding enzyme)
MPPQTPTSKADLSPAAERRVEEIEQSDLTEYVEAALTEFQQAVDIDPIAVVERTYLVGSVLQQGFTPGDSDIDVVVIVDRRPADELKDTFWRYWEDGHSTQTMLSSQIAVEYTKVDVCDVVDADRANAELEPPYYRL